MWAEIDSAPKDGTPILISGGYWDSATSQMHGMKHDVTSPAIYIRKTNPDVDPPWSTFGGFNIKNPTHWMPLPEPPVIKGETK